MGHWLCYAHLEASVPNATSIHSVWPFDFGVSQLKHNSIWTVGVVSYKVLPAVRRINLQGLS